MKTLFIYSKKIPFLITPLAAALFTIAAPFAASQPQAIAAETLIAKNETTQLETVVVLGHRLNQLGQKLSAAEGTVGSAEIANRPVLRTGEILEFVPGMVVTQHSGSGKANQYFCAVLIWTMAPTLIPVSMVCRSICALTATVRVIRI